MVSISNVSKSSGKSSDDNYKFMDTIQNTFFAKMDDLMYEINNIHNHPSDLEDKKQ